MARRTRIPAPIVNRPLPAPGARVVRVCGPGESALAKYAHPADVGTVLTLVTDRWGTQAVVLWGDGRVYSVSGLTTVGIGIYLASGNSTTDY